MRLVPQLLALALLTAVPAVALSSPSSSRLDPRLASAVATAEPVTVWVEFSDKGEAGPADLARRLATAEASLTPEARRRRERAHVSPIVDWLDLPVESGYLDGLRAAGLEPFGVSRWFNRVAVRTTGDRLPALAALPFVQGVAPVERARRAPTEPVEPVLEERFAPGVATPAAAQVLYGQTATQLARLNVPAMHDSGYIGTFVNIAILDDGFNFYRKHEALRTMNVGGTRTRDFVRGIVSVQDTVDNPSWFQHGTMVMSAVGGNKPGRYVGPAHGANYLLARTEYDPTEKPIEMVYWGMAAEWADSLGADIITTSLGYNLFPDSAGMDLTYAMLDGHTSIVTRAASIAARKGILVVCSAGNDGNNPAVGRKVGAPADANGDSVIAIGAVDSLGNRASFSSKGPTVDGRIKPDLTAQGVQVLLASPSGDPNSYVRASGTSFSAPLTAGLAACLMQARPNWPPVWIIEALKRTASRATSPDTLFGWGIPNGLAALRYIPTNLQVPEVRGPLAFAFRAPNPLRAGRDAGEVRIRLGADAPAATCRVRVHDASGRVVRDFDPVSMAPGSSWSVPWNGEDSRGRLLQPGLYFLSLEGAGRRSTRRVVLLR
jgi:subtilisin family serine protease